MARNYHGYKKKIMDRENQTEKDLSKGPQGIDKAPGEERASNNTNPVTETQKGKNKVDGDLSQESDKPLEHQDI